MLVFFGSGTWIRTMIKGFRVPRPAVRRSRIDAKEYAKFPASCQVPRCLYNTGHLLFCLAMSTTFAETTELELLVLPVAMSDDAGDEDLDEDEEDEEGDEDFDGEDLDEDGEESEEGDDM